MPLKTPPWHLLKCIKRLKNDGGNSANRTPYLNCGQTFFSSKFFKYLFLYQFEFYESVNWPLFQTLKKLLFAFQTSEQLLRPTPPSSISLWDQTEKWRGSEEIRGDAQRERRLHQTSLKLYSDWSVTHYIIHCRQQQWVFIFRQASADKYFIPDTCLTYLRVQLFAHVKWDAFFKNLSHVCSEITQSNRSMIYIIVLHLKVSPNSWRTSKLIFLFIFIFI